eukprot:scpid12877/ scgid35076/ 
MNPTRTVSLAELIMYQSCHCYCAPSHYCSIDSDNYFSQFSSPGPPCTVVVRLSLSLSLWATSAGESDDYEYCTAVFCLRTFTSFRNVRVLLHKRADRKEPSPASSPSTISLSETKQRSPNSQLPLEVIYARSTGR